MVFAGVSHTVDHRLHQGMVGIGHEDAVEGRHAPRFLVEPAAQAAVPTLAVRMRGVHITKQHATLEHPRKHMARIQRVVFGAIGVGAQVIIVATREEGLRIGSRRVVVVYGGVRVRCLVIIVLGLAFVTIFQAKLLAGGKATAGIGQVARHVVLSGHPIVVHVVHVAREREARFLPIEHGEQSGLVAVARAKGEVHVADVTMLVLLLQVHVEHQFLVAHVHALETALAARLVVHLDLVDRVGGQVLQRLGGIAVEEVAAIDQQ